MIKVHLKITYFSNLEHICLQQSKINFKILMKN